MAVKSFGSKEDIRKAFVKEAGGVKVSLDFEGDTYEFFIRVFDLADRARFAMAASEYQRQKALEVEGDSSASDANFRVESIFNMLTAGLANEQGQPLYDTKAELLADLQGLDQNVAIELVDKIIDLNGLSKEAADEAVKNSDATQS